MSLGPPAAADVGETQWQFSAADRIFAGAGTCACSNCSLYTSNGMFQTGFKSVDTNRCVCKGPFSLKDKVGVKRPPSAVTRKFGERVPAQVSS
ncbi:hypothetical protein AVEN_29704-1 [Araneus ventricosus]|uniref:Uncharacterized protein n=1 Tax=Araneus ventricosus TaxID=182803 RepID=A0A4Y2U195_ARAVE|nr:hypothetical protein AVEN_29704-1 [Araneus ventricosus]